MKQNKKFYVGAMTGTSHDAIDISFIDIEKNISLKYFYSKKMPTYIKTEIKRCIESQNVSLSELGKLNKAVGILFSRTIQEAIKKSKLKRQQIGCISISGQTIRHEIDKKNPFSMQIGDPNIISVETGLPVIHDFRNMHIALGGEGAPLVPEFHTELFYKPNTPRIILNIGGIANYSYVKNKNVVWGSDVGPGNALMDFYCQKFLNKPFDTNGRIASKGKILENELKRLLNISFFKKSFPKSTGKELFNTKLFSTTLLKNSPENILATLAELTAVSISDAIKKNKHQFDDLIICGGGAKNKFLINRISNLVSKDVMLSENLGYDVQAIESMAFAWMGYKRLNNESLKVQIEKNKYNKGLLGSVTLSKP